MTLPPRQPAQSPPSHHEPAQPGLLVTDEDYRTLADFRHYLRRFLAFSEQATAAAGMPASQYQALLALRALAGSGAVTTSALAERLCVKLNSVVEMVDRLIAAGMVQRSRSVSDRRSTVLSLTRNGTVALAPLAAVHLTHHRAHLPELIETMRRLMARSTPHL